METDPDGVEWVRVIDSGPGSVSEISLPASYLDDPRYTLVEGPALDERGWPLLPQFAATSTRKATPRMPATARSARV